MCSKSFIPVFLFLSTLLFSISPLSAQDTEESGQFGYDLAGKWNLAVYLNLGAGLDDHEVGQTSENKPVNISGGGGYGGAFSIGYGLNQKFEVAADLGFQDSPLVPDVENADGSFMRTILSASLRYRLPVASEALLVFGAGAGYYGPDDMDIDMSKVAGGGHNIFKYDSGFGPHVTAEYVGFINDKFTWTAGLKYYYVKYSLNSAVLDGINVPAGSLPDAIKNEIGELDGSGIDLIVSFHMYL